MGKKKIKNTILGSVTNVGSIVIGNQVNYHVSKDEVKESIVMSNHSVDKIQQIQSAGEVFIMYSWDSETHKEQVLSLWKTLRDNGFKTVIDRQESQENTATDFNVMMHKAITHFSKVVIVLSEGYAERANNFKGGVGFEYSMVIKDINDFRQKYILVSFDKITDAIFPAFLKGREVIQLGKDADLENLYGKLMDVPEFKIPEVAALKPEIKIREIKPLFESKGISIVSVNGISDAGSHLLHKKYIHHNQEISILIKNESNNVIGDFKIKVEIPKSLAEYDTQGEYINGFRIFNTTYNEKLYPDEIIEIQCGKTRIHYIDAEKAFNSSIKIFIYSDLGKTELIQPIDGFLYGTRMFKDKKLLTLSDFHDKNADIRKY
jgi:hypothetical protein